MKNTALRFYQQLVLKHPRVWLGIIIAISLLAIFHARNFHLDASADSLVMENDPALQYYRATNKTFQSDGGGILIISYTPTDAPLFSRQALDQLSDLEASIKQLPSVGSTYSLLDVPLLFSPKQSFSDLASNPRSLRDKNIDPASTEKEFTTTNPMYRDFLVSKDGKTAALIIKLARDDAYYKLLHERDKLRDKQRKGGLSDAEQQQLARVEAAYSQHEVQAQGQNTRMIEQVRGIMSNYTGNAKLFLGGIPMIASDMIGYIKSDLKTFGTLVLALLVVLLFVIFRKLRWVIIPLLCCGISTLWVVGWLGWMDWKVTVISSNFIALLLIIDISVTIYLIVRYRELQADFPDASTAWLVEQACLLMIRPCLCMVLAAMVGFGSLVISGIRPVIDFGWMMAIGVGISLPVCYLLFPSLVQLLPREKKTPQLNDITLRFSRAMGRFTERFIWLPPLIAVILVVLIGIGSSELTVQNRFIDYFRHSTQIYQGMRDIDQRLGGTTPLEIVIDAPKAAPPASGDTTAPSTAASASSNDGWGPATSATTDGSGAAFDAPAANDSDANGFDAPPANGFDAPSNSEGFGGDAFAAGFDSPSDGGFAGPDDGAAADSTLTNSYWFTPAHLEKLVQIQHYLNSIPANGKVLSLGTTYELAKKLNGGPLSYVQLMLMAKFIPADIKQQLVTPFLSKDGNSVRIMIRVIDSKPNLNRNTLIKKIKNDLITQFDLAPSQVHMTGAMVLYNNMLQSLFDSQIKTLGIVLAVIFLILLALFRSLKMAFIAILPNAISATSILGLMGFLGMPLDLMAITITSITIGLAVNDSIHYIYRFYEEFPDDRDYLATMHRCHGSITTAMCYTSSMIVLGFSILSLSNFMPTVHFGLLTGFAILVALAANMTLLPALLVLLKPKIPEQAVLPPRVS